MTRHDPPTGIPCAVCLARIGTWHVVNDEPVADCMHTASDIEAVRRAVLNAAEGLPVGTPIRWPDP